MDRHAGIDLEGVLVDGDGLVFMTAELIANVADELLEQHLQRHDTSRAAVFVHDDRHLVTGALHLEEERSDQLRLGGEHGGSHGEINGRVLRELALGDAAEHVFDPHYPNDVVLRILEDRKARMRCFGKSMVEVADDRAPLEPDHLCTGYHHLIHAPVTELEDAGEELRLFRLQHTGLCALRDEPVDLFRGMDAVSTALSGPQAERVEDDVSKRVE